MTYRYDESERKRLNNLRRRVNRARRFMENTDPCSRHVHLMAENLIRYGSDYCITDEPDHAAESMLAVLESLWKLRTEIGWPTAKDDRRWAMRKKAMRRS